MYASNEKLGCLRKTFSMSHNVFKISMKLTCYLSLVPKVVCLLSLVLHTDYVGSVSLFTKLYLCNASSNERGRNWTVRFNTSMKEAIKLHSTALI